MQSVLPKSRHPFAVICRCGRRLEGERTAVLQQLRCPDCNRTVIAFPFSPIRKALEGGESGTSPTISPASRSGHRKWTAIAAILLGTVLIVGTIAYWAHFAFFSTEPVDAPLPPKSRLEQSLSLVDQALREGDFGRAMTELDTALAVAEEHPGLLPKAEGRQLRQTRRQAALIRDLMSESLGEVLRRVPGVSEQAWQAQFAERHRGRAILFDATMHRDAAGQYHFGYRVFTDNGEAHIRWDDLVLLRGLPLEDPTRMMIGARLAAAHRDASGRWVVHLQPESGVLITDPRMFSGLSLPPPDEETRAVLARQAEWLKER